MDKRDEKTNNTFIVTYDCKSKTYSCLTDLNELCSISGDGCIWKSLSECGVVDKDTAKELCKQTEQASVSDRPVAYFKEIDLIQNGVKHRCNVGIILTAPQTTVTVTFTLTPANKGVSEATGTSQNDELTGLLNTRAFYDTVEYELKCNSDIASAGKYAFIYFDIQRFKAINDLFSMAKGDELLVYIADRILSFLGDGECGCRIGSDRFVVFMKCTEKTPEHFVSYLVDSISKYDIPFEVTFNAGIFLTTPEPLMINTMVDRAILAQSSIKGSYTVRYNYFTESLRNQMLGEQEIVGMMATALNEKQFIVHYQPQYNHSTGMLIGAEALVRWNHPDSGIISPGIFIPIFEKNGFITNLDLYVFEEVCIFLKKCIDKKLPVVPISTNFSRYDIFVPDFVERLEAIRTKHDVPVKYLRVEITESAVVGGSQHTNDIIKKLHDCGYIIEMDDFGSGYSSLNVLKDIELDIIKLDMQFLSDACDDNKKGGTILSSVVRMAKWLSMPVIAEGVESVAQADFLRSIGCDYIQGYLYSKPLPEENYVSLISGNEIGAKIPQLSLIDTLNAFNFWDPKSMETLIFSNYVGGAAIFDYHDGQIEILRVNKKYLEELSMNLSEKDLIESDPLRFFDEENKKIYLDMLKRAIATGEEQECETWRDIASPCCGTDRFCIRCSVRMIGGSGDNYLFYAMIRNITSEKLYYESVLDSERRFKYASEQVNIYYWEYTIATKEMRPCFRCMRDMGLPPLLTNYPEPVFERGIFPMEYYELYNDWHRQIAEGAEHLEGVFFLTPNRIPFRVKYTTEFDSNGRPIKAYASAALIVE